MAVPLLIVHGFSTSQPSGDDFKPPGFRGEAGRHKILPG